MSQLWPWSKVEEYIKGKSPSPGKTPAVLFASGNLSPTHRGHVLMLHQAEDRLRRLGYEVLGGWLSPSHDLAVLGEAKARGVPELRHKFRLHLAELSVMGDPFVAVSAWEAEDRKVHTDHEVARALYDAINHKFSSWFKNEKCRVFCVCGCDHMSKFKLQRGFSSTQLGIVVVPREDTDEVLLEKPSMLVYVAESTPGEAAALSSTKLRQAIIDGNREYVKNAMNLQAARCVLQPTLAEQQVMRIDFEHLGVINPALDIIATDGAWPSAIVARRLEGLDERDTPAVLIVSGYMGPVHNGHFEVLKQGRERLERAGYKMLGSFLSPQNATGAAMEMRSAEGSQDEVALSTGFRLRTTKTAVSGNDFVALGSWEASVMGRVPTPYEVMDSVSQTLNKCIPEIRQRTNELRVFYACEPGQANRRGLNKHTSHVDRGVVIVPRADEDCFLLEKPSNLFFVADPTECEANIVVGAKIRAALQCGNTSYVTQNVPPTVARLLLSPTPSELTSMQADFQFLQPKNQQSSTITTDPARLQEAKAKFKAVLKAWAGPSEAIAIEDVAKLLLALDPSWTHSEIKTFSSGAFEVSKSGNIPCESLVEWMFAGRC